MQRHHLLITIILALFSYSINAQIVSIPDAIFKTYLLADANINTNGDTEIQITEAQVYSGAIEVSNLGISSLLGIESFIALTELRCNFNNLTSLDISTNIALEILYCNNNNISSLDVSNNLQLQILYINSNALTSIDVSNNSILRLLSFASNGISTLDVSANPALTQLDFNINNLTSINVSNNPLLVFLNCAENNLSVLDVSNNSLLRQLHCAMNGLSVLDLSNQPVLDVLSASYNQFTSLDLSANPNLAILFCHYNNLTSINVSNCPLLSDFRCFSNQLSVLDVSNNPALIALHCVGNNLTSLDVSTNHVLTRLFCGYNLLSSLNLKNGNNTNVTTFFALNNPNLYCIEVDDANYSTSNWSDVDPIASFSPTCPLCSSSDSTLATTACNSYTVPSGDETYFSTGIYQDTIPNFAGCDSILTINLAINTPTTGVDTQTACDSFTWMDGNTYYASNSSATHILTNSNGCDSVVTLDLTINNINSSVTQTGEILTANQAGATYQWLDCPAMTPINGAIGQSYTVTSNGTYAVIITNNNCSDTSACYAVIGLGVVKKEFNNDILAYPNPTDGNFSINLRQKYSSVKVTISDLNGKLIQSKTYNEAQFLALQLEAPTGVYLLVVESKNKKSVIRLIKK